MNASDDPLWLHFASLWQDLRKVGSGLLVAGGYGLFLKQQWAGNAAGPLIAIPMERWQNATPRVTKDLDLIIGLDLISNEINNGQLLEILEKQGFKVSENPEGKRWQFFKKLDEHRQVVAELHAPTPGEKSANLQADRIRVKHKPSMGEDGVHGRHNPEAVGCHLNPFRFPCREVEIAVPNPLTWSIMKLVAAEDHWARSRASRQDQQRAFSREQATKHARDVCRAIAMMTIGERDSAGEIVAAIKDSPQFIRAAKISNGSFWNEGNWVHGIVGDQWLPEDLATIHNTLSSWFAA